MSRPVPLPGKGVVNVSLTQAGLSRVLPDPPRPVILPLVGPQQQQQDAIRRMVDQRALQQHQQPEKRKETLMTVDGPIELPNMQLLDDETMLKCVTKMIVTVIDKSGNLTDVIAAAAALPLTPEFYVSFVIHCFWLTYITTYRYTLLA
jgi:hypothetical protein